MGANARFHLVLRRRSLETLNQNLFRRVSYPICRQHGISKSYFATIGNHFFLLLNQTAFVEQFPENKKIFAQTN